MLERVARSLEAAAGGRKAPARLFFFTDPARTPDPVAAAERLPAGTAVVLRAFGAEDAGRIGRALREVTARSGGLLLVGADAALAQAIEADGVHLPERSLGEGRALRTAHPDWILTGAVHSAEALERAAEAGLDAAVLSPVFASASPSAGEPLGVARFTALVAGARLPVIALGGVTEDTAESLLGSGAAALAAVGAFSA